MVLFYRHSMPIQTGVGIEKTSAVACALEPLTCLYTHADSYHELSSLSPPPPPSVMQCGNYDKQMCYMLYFVGICGSARVFHERGPRARATMYRQHSR